MRIDAGTSIALFAQARDDFHEQTAMEAVITFLRRYGRPHQMTFDSDPRWVGSVSGRDFPSQFAPTSVMPGDDTPNLSAASTRQECLPGKVSSDETRQECLQIHQPSALQEVCEVTEAFLQHDNEERPHQGRACGNVPPCVAFPVLPTLPTLAIHGVDPDAWLATLDQKKYLRHVGRDGCEGARSFDVLHRPGDWPNALSCWPRDRANTPVRRLARGPGGQAASRSPV